jgi:hypothetical protein
MAGRNDAGDVQHLDRPAARGLSRILALQHAELERGRTRAVVVFGASAVSSAFMVGQVLPSGALSLAALMAFIAIGAVTILTMSLRAEVEAGRTVARRGRGAEEGPEHDAGGSAPEAGPWTVVADNRAKLGRQTLFVQIAITLLVVQIALSSIDLAGLR